MRQLDGHLSMTTTSKRWLIIFAVAMVTVAPACRGQSALHWSTYKTADGLSTPTFDTISFTPQGGLIATRFNASLAFALDGYSVSNFPAPAECVGRICESPGGQRWTLVPNGLMELKNGTWLLHSVPEIEAAIHAGYPRPGATPSLLPIRQGTVLVLLPDRLMEFLNENPDAPRTSSLRLAAQGKIGDFTGMAVSHDESLWISGTRGLAKIAGPARNLEPDTTWQEYTPPAALAASHFSQPVPGKDGSVMLVGESAANHQKVVVTFEGENWAALPAGTRNFFCAWREPDQTLWAVTTNALFQWEPDQTNWVEHEDISAGRISDVAVEPDGAFWLATSDGLFRGSPPVWSKPEALRDLDSPVQQMEVGSDGALYFLSANKLQRLENEVLHGYPLPAAGQGARTAPVLFPLKDGTLVVDSGNVLFQFKPAIGLFKALPTMDQSNPVKPLGLLPDGSVCLYQGGEHPVLEEYDGIQVRPLPDPPTIDRGEDTPNTLFTAHNGNVWLGGGRAVFWHHEGRWERFVSDDHNTPEAVVAFAELADGRIWCASSDELWAFDGKKWSLVSGRFNHINSLLSDHEGEVWLASNGGLFRFCGGVLMENGEPEGLPGGAVTALCETKEGQIWAGGTHGPTLFHPQADLDPPKTYVRWLGGNSHRLTEGDTLNLLFEGADKWKITPQGRLLYSAQLDQHGWSAFQELTMFTFPEPAAGRHFFQVRAMDRNGNVDPVAATLDFMVVTPWFREIRLWIVLLLGVAAAIFFAGIALNRHRQLVRSHAAVELKVAERTRELEMATRELLHSQKMNALGTLAAGIAHDFNNILSIIKGSAQIIEDNTHNPEKIRTRVDRINTVVQQGAEIVDAMLGFGRGSDAAVLPCDVNAVVADTVKLLGDRFLREVEVKFDRAEKLPELSTSRGFIQQILLNFIFNAAEATNNRKQIILATRMVDRLPPDIFLPPAAAAAFVLISVQDQGSGMAPEIKARIFEPFFTTKAMSTKRGTGLGLSMVYELAKKMGGGLAVQSAPGDGSKFTLILPVHGLPLAKTRPDVPAEPLPT